MSADPFQKLRLPDEAIAPRTAFTNTLRTRLAHELGIDEATTNTTRGAVMAEEIAPSVSVTPYLCVRGAAAALEFYATVFGAVEINERYVDESDGRIGHAEFRIGSSVLYISDEYPDYEAVGPETLNGTSVALSVYVDDVDVTYARARAAGAHTMRPPTDQFYGRSATIRDPWGHRWAIQTAVTDRPLPKVEGFDVIQPESTSSATPDRTARALELLNGPAQLGYFALWTPDPQRAAVFFGALFGWAVEPSGHVSNIDPPGGLASGAADRAPTLYFQVPDIEAAIQRVTELGGTVLTTSNYESGANAECIDDQGTRFDLHLPNPGYERQ